MRRVVITGHGAITPLGNTAEEFWKALLAGKSGIGPITRFDSEGFSSRIAGEVKGFDPQQHIEARECKRMDRFVQFALAASQMAVEDSGLDVESVNKERFGVVAGSGIGGIETIETQKEVYMKKGPRRISPFLIPMLIIDIAAGHISMRYGARGPNLACVTACATGTHCAGVALRSIQRGEADIIIAGGSEAALTPLGFGGFSNMKALSTRNDDPEHASRPFDKDRDGFIMSEGCGMVVMESLEHAKARGARIYSELCGFGMTADAHHITAPAPDGEGAQRAMKAALEDGGMNPEDVDYINAHGTSTELNDRYESMAIRHVFKDHADQLVVSSTKSMTGHLMGAAGGIELIATSMALSEGCIPPTMNHENPGEDCDLDYCPGQAREQDIQTALSNSFGFGGHNAVLALRKFKG